MARPDPPAMSTAIRSSCTTSSTPATPPRIVVHCTALDGRVFVFAVLMNRTTRTSAARAIQDRIAIRLARYRAVTPAPTVDGGTGGAGPTG